MGPIDRKFKIHAEHMTKEGVVFDETQAVLFLAKDNAFPPTLEFYIEELKCQGAGELQIENAQKLLERVNLWRAAHPERCRVADVELGAEAEHVLGRKE